MRPFIIALITLIVFVSPVFGEETLSETRLNSIISSPHSAELTETALKIYPASRAYHVTMTNTLPDGRSATMKFTATEKWVDGRYIVSEAQPAGPDTKYHMVVDYDAASKTYRQYIVIAGKLTGYQVGTRIGSSRSIAWIDLSASKFSAALDCSTVQNNTDTATTWQSRIFEKGILQRTETGEAKVSKP